MTRTVRPRILVLLAATSAAACIDTPNGSTFSGTNVGRSVHLTGFALSPGDTITVEVLSNADDNPDSSSSTWIPLGSTTASTNPITWVGDQLYPFAIDVTPVPVWWLGARWRGGGMVRLRAKNGDGNLVQTFDDTDCYGEALGDVKPFTQIFNECKSHDTPVLTFVDTDPVSSSSVPYLTRRANAAAESAQYNSTINAPINLTGWQLTRGFLFGPDVEARYYNRGDLGIGREMHCRTLGFSITKPTVACYVTNYGSVLDGLADASSALNDAINGHQPFATVAMDYWPFSSTNKVRFYTYGANGALLTSAALDTEGAKPIPGLCLSCHGGVYNPSTNSVSGAKFLPFDLEAFGFASSGTYSRSGQEEEFRRLNKIVLDTDPGSSTASLIHGWYGGPLGVAIPGTKQDSAHIPSGWAGEEVVYQKAVAPYCRTCHVAVGFPIDTFAQLQALSVGAQSNVCDTKQMPHAEITRNAFWRSSARAHLAGALSWADGCQ